jgi:hypothetical protein
MDQDGAVPSVITGRPARKQKGVLDMLRINELAAALLTLVGFIAAPAGSADLRPGEIVTVLPKDAIPAIMSPSLEDGNKATSLRSNDLVVGVKIGDDARAYPISTLSRHEIVNDNSAVIPFAVTW